ncbi:FadR/GntR family transcriptional regulator [Sphingobacterium rhinopitheci]|uniref:FadR/GntR family transcriptional regulator n=1 Tax=Sphingobacterium rhinopitheci TaxID=2781960 RepID=UPI001F52747F|nr:FCD domain-containing protein [Sphingobacterium rhinopitheci]MCI0919811.1 FadR family transcriptional regulator [Sphingobacterium rhinopitheci]
MSNLKPEVIKIPIIDTSSLVDKAEEAIINYIKLNQLTVGDVLPKELDLAVQLGVSRTVIRESLLRLKAIGLIESKKHKGAIITNPDVLGSMKKIFHPSILDTDTLKDLFEMRLALEVGIADFIINKITDKDIQELEQMTKSIVSGDTALPWSIEDEKKFHGKLYEISGNGLLLEIQEMLIPIFQYVHQSGILEKPIIKGEFISHHELVEVLKKRDAEAYRKAIRIHLNNHFERILT